MRLAASLADGIERRPAAAFAAFAALHLAVWAALPRLLHLNPRPDLVEALTDGRDWQLDYDKLPPLPWWLAEAAYRLAGPDLAYYALPQIAVVAAFAIVWAMARPLAGALGALVAVLTIDGVHYLNYSAVKFNPGIIQLPLWALAGFAFHRALRQGRIADWTMLGAAIGLSLWTSYFLLALAAPLLLFLVVDRDARRTLATPGPYLALVVALVVMAPHLVWLAANGFPAFNALPQAASAYGWLDHLLRPLGFAVAQFAFLLPALFIGQSLFWPRGTAASPPSADAFDRRIVTLLAFAPPATMLALAAIAEPGTVAISGSPLWLFLGLWLVVVSPRTITTPRLKSIVISWAIIFAAFVLTFMANYGQWRS
jgi:hypothetical protein